MLETKDITLSQSLEINSRLEEIICQKDAVIRDFEFKLAKAEQELNWLKRQIFGVKSERFIPQNSAQLALDFEYEQVTPEPEEVQKEQVSYEREKPSGKKSKPVRAPIPAHLPRQEEVIEPENLPVGAKKIGEEVTELLEYKPGLLFVRKIVRPKYALPQEGGITIGQLPELPFPKSNAGAGIVAHILISKYTDHLPYYRQRQQFKRQGLDIAESTINGWVRESCRLLQPLYERMQAQLLQADYLQADETPIPVLTDQKPGSTHKGYFWVYHSPLEKIVLFDYRKSRSREGPEDILSRFKGALQTDGYGGYNGFSGKAGIIRLGCMAHARRKFEQAKENDPIRAEQVLLMMQQLYSIERQARQEQYSTGQRLTLRQQKSIPLLKQLEQYLKTEALQVLPKSAIGNAIKYTLELWPNLKRYTEDGRWELDNNLIENKIRPVALGRKNYLFAGSHESAQQAAMLYSLIGTCQLNQAEPFAWLKDVINRLPAWPVNRLHELLPTIHKVSQ